jgi:SpoIID/LytB domain protein
VPRTTLRLLTALGALALLAPATAVHADGNGYPVRDSVAEVGDQLPDFRLEGAGWGHGVGMSQYGAYARARAGQSRSDILRAYFTGTALETRDTTRRIDVGLRQGVSANSSTHVDVTPVDGAVSWRVTDEDGSTTTLQQARGERWFVCPNSSSTRIQDAPCGTSSGNREDIDSFGARDVFFDVQHHGTVIHTSDAGGEFKWGTHRIIRTSSGLTTVQRVPDVETYLKGIAEVPDSWGNHGGAAALQAQAIAARGYALTNDRRGHACICDILNSTTDQVYRGWHKERQAPNWVAAVQRTQNGDGTRGEVLTHNGSIIPAFYSSSNGGRSENVSEVWGSSQSSFPYLRSVEDPYSLDDTNPYRSWTASVSNRDLARALDSDLRSVEQVSIEGRTAGGTPKAIAYRGRDAAGNPVSGTLSNSNGVGAGVTLRSRLSSGVDVVRADGSAGVNALPSSQVRRIAYERAEPFTDIEDSVHEHAIVWTSEAGIAQGFGDGTFRPGGTVTRGQMASFIYRTFDIPASDGDSFRDVDPGQTHGDAINALADAGIAQGFDDGRFRPGASVTRAQMASFLVRAIGLDEVAPDGRFRDVTGGTHAGTIHAIAQEGITLGCASDRYCPNDTVRRGQMASFLYRTVEGG